MLIKPKNKNMMIDVGDGDDDGDLGQIQQRLQIYNFWFSSHL